MKASMKFIRTPQSSAVSSLMFRVACGVFFFGLFQAQWVFAQDPVSSESSDRAPAARSEGSRKRVRKQTAPTPMGSTSPTEATETPEREPRRSGKKREKEIEGSQALNRFESDSVLRSQYQHQGKPLEVDPD